MKNTSSTHGHPTKILVEFSGVKYHQTPANFSGKKIGAHFHTKPQKKTPPRITQSVSGLQAGHLCKGGEMSVSMIWYKYGRGEIHVNDVSRRVIKWKIKSDFRIKKKRENNLLTFRRFYFPLCQYFGKKNREIAWVLLLVSKPERAGLLVWGKIKKKSGIRDSVFRIPPAPLSSQKKASHASEPLKRVH